MAHSGISPSNARRSRPTCRALSLLLALLLAPLACHPGDPSGTASDGPSPDAPASFSPLSLRVPANTLSRVELSRTPAGTNERRVTLERGRDGWMMTSPTAYKANRAAVESIVALLAEIEITSVAGADERTARKVGLDQETAIVVRAWVGDRLASHFAVGRSGRDATHVQRVGDPRILTVRGRCRPLLDKSADDLRHPVITDLDLTHIERVTYGSSLGRLALIADPAAPGRFHAPGTNFRNFDQDRASKDVAVVAHLLAKGFVDAPSDPRATGLFDDDTPRAELRVRAEGGTRTVNVWVGARTKDGRLHVRTSESDQVYLVSAHLESSLVPRRSHFERSDEAMKQLAAERERRLRAEGTHADASASAHTHAPPTAPPSHVPSAMMAALRALASEQRAR